METPGEPIGPAAHTNDGFFKAVFSQPEHATAFFKSHLPPAVTAKIDWQSLTALPGSFVKTSLQQVHSDLLFSVHIGERETLLYRPAIDETCQAKGIAALFPMAGRFFRPRSS